MRALVTGASGFIGSHLAEELLKRGFNLRCLVRNKSALRWLEGIEAELCGGDCSDLGSLREAVKDMDYVFHVAGVTKTNRKEDFYSVNTRGTENLARAVLEVNPSIKKFVFLSSLSAAGPAINNIALDEMMPTRPVSHYGRSKLLAEMALLELKDKFPIVILRPPAVYGPKDRDMFLFFKLLKKGFFPYWGESVYSILYVDDLVSGIIKAAESPEAAGKIFFLSEEKSYTNLEIAALISGIYGKKAVKLPVPRSIMPVLAGLGSISGWFPGIINRDKISELRHRNWTCDPGRAKRELGFTPKIKLKEGIKWTADWYRIHQWL